jgi:uncharacterized LabA/DUF88 family protein
MVAKQTMVFVDGQNLFHGGRAYDIDFEMDLLALVEALTEERDLIRPYYFDSYRPGEKESKEGFYHFLRTNGFRVETNALRERDGYYVEKGADIGLATELIAQGFNDSYDVAVVVTGDDDFSQAIRYVQDQGKIVEVASFDANFSANLKEVADRTTVLDHITDQISKD